MARAEDREVPASLEPFAYMIGSWKGAARPMANPLRGWTETHAWAWKFSKGRPIALTFTLESDKTIAKGQLSYDEAAKQYRVEGTDKEGKPVVFTGKLDSKGKMLTLDREGAPAGGGKERLKLFPNSNLVRYSIWVEDQEPGAPQYKRAIEVGVTKEGESFAAGASAADLPKCIITGGAATMTISYQGKTFPICCTGCRDEFNDNPEKYAKKASLLNQSGAGDKKPVKAAASRGKDDGSFDGLVEDTPKSKAMPKESTRSRTKSAASKAKADAPASDDEPAPPAQPAARADSAKAVSLLRLGQSLEKASKTAAALKYYQQVVKDYPDTTQAKDAAARVKVLGGK